MEQKLQQLKTRLAEWNDTQRAADILEWDQQTYMPPGGADARAAQRATLNGLAHRLFVSDEVGALLEELGRPGAPWPYDSDEASLVRCASRRYERLRRIPAELVSAIAQAASLGQAAWVKARKESDYAQFKPLLARLIELKRQVVQCLRPYDHPYDPLLDEFEPGMKTADVQALFDGIKQELVGLVREIGERGRAADDELLRREYPPEAQRALGQRVARALGFDFDRGRQDESAHPFTIRFSNGDVRMTTRFQRNWLPSSLFGTVHETGHALYEQGVDGAIERSPLAEGASFGMHESQSRLWENLVARSRAFTRWVYPELQAAFPQALGNVDAETYYRAVNRVKPSLIRVEADEVTYNLHIFVRFELEQAVVRGDLGVDDLPEAWNNKFQSYLGIRPPNDAQGLLQDVHWSAGYLGYFPTYALGNLLSVQIYEAARRALPDLEAQFARGEFAALREWLRANIHRHGSKFTAAELIERVTGGPLDSRPYVRYLQAKYRDLYGL